MDALLVATKAAGLEEALERIEVEPALVLPLLNGLDHIARAAPTLRLGDRARRLDPRRGRPARSRV